MSRAYVLLRFYYAVPAYEDQDKVRFFGGWAGVKERDKQFNILYPLRQNEDGSLEISKPFGADTLAHPMARCVR